MTGDVLSAIWGQLRCRVKWSVSGGQQSLIGQRVVISLNRRVVMSVMPEMEVSSAAQGVISEWSEAEFSQRVG